MKVPNTVKAYISSLTDVMCGIRNSILIALSNHIVRSEVEGIRAIIVNDLITGLVLDVNHNKF